MKPIFDWPIETIVNLGIPRNTFFASAAEAMRRILIENARKRKTARAGGQLARQFLSTLEVAGEDEDERLLALDEALTQLKAEHLAVGRLVELRYFAGLTVQQAASVLKISKRTADRYWAYAKAWLTNQLN